MVAADAIAIGLGIGIALGTHLPERLIRYGAAAAFAVFGAMLIIGSVTG
jgi:Ca2+/H+ antiporter, TMEM165/GDT1 family